MKTLGEMDECDALYRDLAESVLPTSNLIDRKNEIVEAPQDPRFQIARTMAVFRNDIADVKRLSLFKKSFN